MRSCIDRPHGQVVKIETSEDDTEDDDKKTLEYYIDEMIALKSHTARICQTASRPNMGQHVMRKSFDHIWRLWKVEPRSQLLPQAGHAREVYGGVGLHLEGSLAATTEFCRAVQNWDLCSSRAVCYFQGHAKLVLVCGEYSANGYQLATVGTDDTIKLWDTRKRKLFASIPAQSSLMTHI